jgi:hypothetical protein
MAVRRTGSAVSRTKDRQKAAPVRQPVRLPDMPAISGEHVWRGASGTPYLHTVSSLLFCREMPEATYVLVHRDAEGLARVLRVGCLDNQAWSLNLAHIRQVGATLGANEVHIRPQAGPPAERARIAFDIENALLTGDQVLRATAAPDKPLSRPI